MDATLTPDGMSSSYRPDETMAGYTFNAKYGSFEGNPTVKNYPNQGMGGTILKMGLTNIINDELLAPLLFDDVLPIMTIHDENIFDCDRFFGRAEVAERIQYCMTTKVHEMWEDLFGTPFTVPLTVSCKVGPTWGSMTPLKLRSI